MSWLVDYEAVRDLGFHSQPQELKWAYAVAFKSLHGRTLRWAFTDSQDVVGASRLAGEGLPAGLIEYGHSKQWYGNWHGHWYKVPRPRRSDDRTEADSERLS